MRKSLFYYIAAALFFIPFAAEAEDISLGQVVLRGLDKITGRLSTMTVDVGDKAQFGALDIYARVCYTHPPEELPENAAFLEIVEKKPEGQAKLFSGWMFSSSPALSAMDHPVYDVWVIKCQGEKIIPPTPEPLILENPIEIKKLQPKVKVSVEETEAVSEAPQEQGTDILSRIEEDPTADETHILVQEEGAATLIPLPEKVEEPSEESSEEGAADDSLQKKTGEEEENISDEPIEGETFILRRLPEKQPEDSEAGVIEEGIISEEVSEPLAEEAVPSQNVEAESIDSFDQTESTLQEETLQELTDEQISD